VKTPISII